MQTPTFSKLLKVLENLLLNDLEVKEAKTDLH